MTETTSNTTSNETVFSIERIYLKDLSLEQPNSPAIFTSKEQPTLDISFSIGNSALDNDSSYYEVTVQATVTTKLADGKTVFLIEAKQAGIFLLQNIPTDHVGPLLGIRCPQIIYPYLRAQVANTVGSAGFPVVHLPEINFEQIYEQQQGQQESQIASN